MPKKNCAECGVPTCLAFAMRLAGGQAKLDDCPYISDEAREVLGSASRPPIKLVRIGVGEKVVEIGDEKVLFRHEKTFYHPPAIAVTIYDTMDSREIQTKIRKINEFQFERIGQTLSVDLVNLVFKSGDINQYRNVTYEVYRISNKPLILSSSEPFAISEALKICKEGRPLIAAANRVNWEDMAELAKVNNCSLVVSEYQGLAELADLVEKVKEKGVDDIVLDFGNPTVREAIENLTIIRRLAINKRFYRLGFPLITFPNKMSENEFDESLLASIFTMKYASIIVFDDIHLWKMIPLLTLRQDIFNDPQRPIQIKPGIYEIGKPSSCSPVMITTNFSLTYFIVSGDIESSKVASYLLVSDTEGQSVLTAWASGKFSPESITSFIKECGIEQRVEHRKLIIPGLVAKLSGKIEELSGWQVLVGPQDSSRLPKFLKQYLNV